ncbi:uncharacterized protein LOC122530282 [Frieseomelitta varia]|uniref:uncharacterized protein LOC122530282 n=1 Tax=Frieseomelitta varia TaxID=561572 RepID=UPI001CB69BEC|nr:uncharacterized protein LOC122530282 [Frieseomelitta varia]
MIEQLETKIQRSENLRVYIPRRERGERLLRQPSQKRHGCHGSSEPEIGRSEEPRATTRRSVATSVERRAIDHRHETPSSSSSSSSSSFSSLSSSSFFVVFPRRPSWCFRVVVPAAAAAAVLEAYV